MKGLIISADGAEDRELFYPYYRLKEEGIEVEVASFSRATITGKRNLEMEVDLTLKEVKVEDYDVLILPGGKAPGKLRQDKDVLRITQEFFREGRPIAAVDYEDEEVVVDGNIITSRLPKDLPAFSRELMKKLK